MREKQIEEMAEAIFQNCNCGLFFSEAEKIARFVIEEQGYRKQSEVIDEFVKKLKDTSMTKWDYHEAVDVEEIDRIAAKMKGGTEE